MNTDNSVSAILVMAVFFCCFLDVMDQKFVGGPYED